MKTTLASFLFLSSAWLAFGADPPGEPAAGPVEAPRVKEEESAPKTKQATPKAKPVPPAVKTGSSRNAPPAPRDPAEDAISKAVADARKELEAVEAQAAEAANELGAQVVELTKNNTAMHEEQKQLEARLRQLDGELESTAKKLASATEARTKAQEGMNLTVGELEGQVTSFVERFSNTVAAGEDPGLLSSVQALKQGNLADLPARVEKLIGYYSQTLDFGDSAGVFETRIQLPSQGGKVERVKVLRMGLLGGYYNQAQGESGIVLSDPEGKAGLKGESTGLAAAQMAEIASMVQSPGKGGFLPFDVTGGSGIAALQTQESWVRWFELGGFAMWPLLVVCLAAVFLVIERSITLTIKSMGIRRRVNKVLALVRAGRPEEAEDLCVKMGGAVGAVLHAALVHRGGERSVMEDAVQEALLHHAPAFQTRLGFIALCAAVAPLLGLFGTVTGMISTFKMVTLFGTSDPRFLAGGISEALITTEAGLMIAIPSLLARGILGSVAESALGKLESGALSVVIALSKAEDEYTSSKEAA